MSYAKLAHDVALLTKPSDEMNKRIFNELTGLPFIHGYLPPYTHSVELASEMLPKDFGYDLHENGEFDTWAIVFRYNGSGYKYYGKRHGATAALALAAAILYVRAELFGEDLSVLEVNKPTPRPDGSRPERY